MEYIQLLPDDEVFPSSMLISYFMQGGFYFYWALMLQLPFKAGLVGECDCRNMNFFSLSDGVFVIGGFGDYKSA